ncbi:MAG: hypothetical protein CVU42_13710 [Chloroflexi bacterium HGW-Chloroflexi-4]|jgi:hypothetical protein|nr:MAG: hypothetical protein CVU42_13710 [Chloroflexi bacterium HGW-Chloroflexi-4]
MEGSAVSGTLELRIIADEDKTESFYTKLAGFLKSNGYEVISRSSDRPDTNDPRRMKFFVTAIPKVRRPLVLPEFKRVGNETILHDGG